MAKRKNTNSPLVYSTDPNFKLEDETTETPSPEPGQQKLRVRLDTKNRGGKSVTIIEGFQGSNMELVELTKKLKNFCGTGGSEKDGLILIQGDQRDKISQWLAKNGFGQVRKS